MIRTGSKHHHTIAELNFTWKGLQGKCMLQKSTLCPEGAQDRTETEMPTEGCGCGGEEKSAWTEW